MSIRKHQPTGSGPCVKQTVTATIVAANGDRFIATNHCMNPQKKCPRGDMPTGVGYELCKSICQQTAHAEVNAVSFAGEAARGATLYLEGHTYACESCKTSVRSAGIERLIVGAAPSDE